MCREAAFRPSSRLLSDIRTSSFTDVTRALLAVWGTRGGGDRVEELSWRSRTLLGIWHIRESKMQMCSQQILPRGIQEAGLGCKEES